MGVDAHRVPGAERHVVRVHAPPGVTPEAPYDLVRKMRASVLVLGPLLARFGRARDSLRGGFASGARPIDQQLKGFRALGAGTTVLENAAREPEVEDLARALNAMGARIQGAGTDLVVVEGVTRLSGVEHTVIPDRIEAGTLLVAAAITRGDVHVHGAVPAHLDAVVGKLREAGCTVVPTEDGLRCKGPDVPEPVDLQTTEHPGFPTDMHEP